MSIACVDRQCLTYGNDKLEDGHTLKSYGIGEGAMIRLSRPDYAESDDDYCIYVQCTEDEGTEKEGTEKEGTEEESTEEEETEKEDTKEEDTEEEDTDGEVFPVWIKASDTIGSLKTRLMSSIAFHGPWRGQHHLIFNRQQLEDGYKFSDYNIQESAVIHFRRQRVFLITVTLNRYYGPGEQIQLEVTGSETIGNLKARLWDGGLIPRSKKIQSQLGS